jgi:hypothetical protein
MQSVPNTTNIVSSNATHARCITGTSVSSMNKTVRHDIIEIVFKVALNIITITLKYHTNCNLASILYVIRRPERHICFF